MSSANSRPRPTMAAISGAILCLIMSSVAYAQVPSDSITAWTQQLRSGSLVERMEAASRLYPIGAENLPESAVDAMLAELGRIQDARLHGTEIEGERELVGEDFGEYFMDLAIFARSVGGPEARRSIILSAEVSLGLARRAATFGNEAIPVLVEMLENDYSTAALEVMGLAWYWADSTGAELSHDSRRTIIEQFVTSGIERARSQLITLSRAFIDAADPSLLPLAQWIHDTRAETEPEAFGLSMLRLNTVPALEEIAMSMDVGELLARQRRSLDILCFDASSGPRLGFCQAASNQMDALAGHVADGRSEAAGEVLAAVLDRIDQVEADGVITEYEHALLAEGLQRIGQRIR